MDPDSAYFERVPYLQFTLAEEQGWKDVKKRSSRSRELLIKVNLANPRLSTRMLYTTYQCVASEKYHIFLVASNRSHYCTYLIRW